jgi:hypothetical protein
METCDSGADRRERSIAYRERLPVRRPEPGVEKPERLPSGASDRAAQTVEHAIRFRDGHTAPLTVAPAGRPAKVTPACYGR